MAEQTYDLMLVIDGGIDASARDEVATAIESLVAKSGGSIAEKTAWGERPLAFEIDGEAVGDYRLMRFSGPGAMIAPLSRQLNITDGLLRHRVIKAVDGAPATIAASAAAAGAERPAATAPVSQEPPKPAAAEQAPAADEAPQEQIAAADAAPSGETQSPEEQAT